MIKSEGDTKYQCFLRLNTLKTEVCTFGPIIQVDYHNKVNND